jgi:hypothetical protein
LGVYLKQNAAEDGPIASFESMLRVDGMRELIVLIAPIRGGARFEGARRLKRARN